MNAQQEFEKKYISSSEICKRLKISRGLLAYARNKGIIPPPIIIPGRASFVWQRQTIEPILKDWEEQLKAKGKKI